ncbi:hypothetical protein PVAND_000661 [Polypedilum vanderplanki]|nr:hypothetical protein PVAND_000661 [Polypedilum vanderplanki]
MNLPIIGAMLKQACCHKDFNYIMDILYIMKNLNLKPNEKIFETLDTFIIGCNFLKKKDNKNVPLNFRKNVKKFKEDLAKWKADMGINPNQTKEEMKILKEKPWDQFQEIQPEGFEETKKARHRRKPFKHIKKIKIKNELVSIESKQE